MSESAARLEPEFDLLRDIGRSGRREVSVDDLLAAILGRVREIIDADTAVVLLTAPGGREVIARGASGIEEEVRQGVRVPIGAGFAGRVASERRAIRLDVVGPETVTNPVLWEHGIRVMLGVPLVSGNDVIGVLHVGRLDDRPFDDEETAVLAAIAERLTSLVQSHQFE